MTAGPGDLSGWLPHLDEVRERHQLPRAAIEGGVNPTHPTFLIGDVVVKVFAGLPRWRESHQAERAALAAVARDPQVLAPRLLAEGRLAAGWPYLVLERAAGVPWGEARLTRAQRLTLAAELGTQVRRLQHLPGASVFSPDRWGAVDLIGAAARSSLPAHLVAQVPAFVAAWPPRGRALVHGDLVSQHLFVAHGRLSAIIDWGDALLTDPHYELIQPHRGPFECDPALLRAFLEGSGWEPDPDFARRALAQALHRQALGLVQHRGMDVFEPVAARLPLGGLPDLDALAGALFRA